MVDYLHFEGPTYTNSPPGYSSSDFIQSEIYLLTLFSAHSTLKRNEPYSCGPRTSSFLSSISTRADRDRDRQVADHCFKTIDEVEYLLDQLPPPAKDEEAIVTKLREKLKLSLEEVRKGAE
ncbi:hypothetical protein BCR39DRAFT_348388 [Naematelia encephala]|uniref:Uncharacterized protein n=1 Tax=Naematelia encephala TaxID=71784 RepID=A0A1Y2ALW9_9TREE|nr:hypothetical protein BCR39DRAFT_348388 [Naematelia encephala]